MNRGCAQKVRIQGRCIPCDSRRAFTPLQFGVEPLRASLINANYPSGQPSEYYNDSVVSHVGLLFKDAPAPVNTSSLMFLYEHGVSFELAPQYARGPDGPYASGNCNYSPHNWPKSSFRTPLGPGGPSLASC